MDMAENFEDRFFGLLQKNHDNLAKQVEIGFKDVNKKVDNNTKITNSISSRVDKLDGKVFGKRTSIVGLFKDRQIILFFFGALFVFLLIVASARGIKLPEWL